MILSTNQNTGDKATDLHSTNITHCAEGYYLSDSGVCRPLCSLWTEPTQADADYVAIIVAIVICLPSSFVLIAVALFFQRKNMYDKVDTLDQSNNSSLKCS